MNGSSGNGGADSNISSLRNGGGRFNYINVENDSDRVDEYLVNDTNDREINANVSPESAFLAENDTLQDPLISAETLGSYGTPRTNASHHSQQQQPHHSSSSSPSETPPWLITAQKLFDACLEASTRATIFLVEWIRQMLRRPLVRSVWKLLKRAGHYIAYFTLLAMLAIIPYVLYGALKDRKLDFAAYNSAFVMTVGTVILSLRLVYLHLTHWYMPEVQKYVVRILWMVPLYSIHSSLSLRFHESRIYIDTIRDFYEGYVIASFVYFLMALLGGQDSLVQILLQKTDANLGQHTWPIKYILNPWELGEDFMLQCKHGVLQYVVFKIVATVLTYAFESVGLYCEGTFDWRVAYPYICFFQNVSVMYALYCLVMLYNAVKEELQHPINWNPLGKFLCVKGVVFFCWWQGILIFWLRAHGIIGDLGDWSSKEVAYGLIDYCIVIEMVGFAIAHSYTFTYKEYLPENLPPQQETREAPISSRTVDGGDGDFLIQNGTTFRSSSHSVSNTDRNNGPQCLDLNGGETQLQQQQPRGTYRPPATLDRPMKFKDALWTSANPKDTIDDIQQFRKSIKLDERIEGLRPPALFRPLSSQEIPTQLSRSSSEVDADRQPPLLTSSTSDQSFVQRLRAGISGARNDVMGARLIPETMINLQAIDSNDDDEDDCEGEREGKQPV